MALPAQNYRDAIRNYGKRVSFAAGESICDPDHPLSAAYLIESGYVSARDHIYVDISRLGLVLEHGDTFGEYAFFEPTAETVRFTPFVKAAMSEHMPTKLPAPGEPYPAPPPTLRPYPSSLRALTNVDAFMLDEGAYLRALADHPELAGWLRKQILVTEYLAETIDALRAQRPLQLIPGFEIAEMAKRGKATWLPANQQETFADDSWIYVAWGRVSLCGGEWSVGAGQILHYAHAGQPLQAVTDSWIIEIPNRQPGHPVGPGGVAKTRVVLIWNGNENRTRPPAIISALTAHLAAVQQQEVGRPDSWRGGLLIVDDATTTPAQEAAGGAGVQVTRTGRADLPAAIFEQGKKTPVVYLDVSHSSPDVVATVAPSVTTVILVDGTRADLPDALQTCSVVTCAVLANESGGGLSTYATGAGRFLRTAFAEHFQTEAEAYAARYVPRTVRLFFEDIEDLPVLGVDALPTRDRDSFARIARAIAGRRVGIALGGGGGWGYAHIALLDALEKRGLPIDAVSGVSFGSLVGAYYAVRNMDFVRTLIGDWLQLLASQLGAAALPPVLGWYLFSKLHGNYLEDLHVPFFPVCLNLQTGDEFTPTQGSVAFGVRASSSLPSFLSPALANGIRAIDGGYINNVPEGILDREGLHFILASSVVQAPSPAPKPWLPLGWTLNPLQRGLDSMRGTGWLMKVSDERDANRARWRFEPFRNDRLRGIQAWQLWKGAEIQARVQVDARQLAFRAYQDWLSYWA
jgi:predicted acylesterase/phospholipase RssA/CRP-like cAMP-binding protein